MPLNPENEGNMQIQAGKWSPALSLTKPFASVTIVSNMHCYWLFHFNRLCQFPPSVTLTRGWDEGITIPTLGCTRNNALQSIWSPLQGVEDIVAGCEQPKGKNNNNKKQYTKTCGSLDACQLT